MGVATARRRLAVRTMARVFVVTFADGFDGTTRRDGKRELSRQRHWSPSSRWALAVTRRARSSDPA